MARNSPTNASKGYSGPPESIPMVSDHFHFRRIFGRLEPSSLSTFFPNSDFKNRQSPLPRGVPLGGQRGVLAPPTQPPHLALLSAIGGLHLAPRGLQTAGSVAQDVGDLLRNFGKIAPDCRELWLRNLGVWHRKLGVWHANLDVWLRCWGNPHLI